MTVRHLGFDDYGSIDGTSLTTSYQDLITLTDDIDILFVFNSTTVSIILTIPSYLPPKTYSTKQFRIPANGSVAIDCRTNSKKISKGTIQVKSVTGAAASGEVTVNVCR